MTASTLNAPHSLVGLTAFEKQHDNQMREYADKLAEAAGEGLDTESVQHYARGSFALGLLLLGMPEEDEEPATQSASQTPSQPNEIANG